MFLILLFVLCTAPLSLVKWRLTNDYDDYDDDDDDDDNDNSINNNNNNNNIFKKNIYKAHDVSNHK